MGLYPTLGSNPSLSASNSTANRGPCCPGRYVSVCWITVFGMQPLVHLGCIRISLKTVLIAAGCSVIAEGLTWVLVIVTDPASVFYRVCAGFHRPAEALRFFLFEGVENHPTFMENIVMVSVFFGAVLFQWFCTILFLFSIVRLMALGTAPAARVHSPEFHA